MGTTRLRARRRLAGLLLAAVLGAGLLPAATTQAVLAAAPSNDDPANAITIFGSAGAVSGSTAEATSDHCQLLMYPPNQSPHRSVWYRWTAPFTGWLHLRTDGSAFEVQLTLQPVWSPCPEAGGSPGGRSIVRQGVTYWLGVGSNNPSIGGAFVVSWFLRRPPPPPNDDFAKALEIFSRYGETNGENANASKEAGEPNHAGEPGGRSLWYRWRAPASGRAMFGAWWDQQGPAAVLAVYTGPSVADLTPVAADDGAGEGVSRVTFNATAGVVYHIAIDTRGGRETGIDHVIDTCATCELSLIWTTGPAPANDSFVNARVVTGDGGFLWAHNVGARSEPGEPSHAEDDNVLHEPRGGASVWYRWTAPVTGEVVFDAGGRDFDALIAAYRGTAVDDLELVAENMTRSLEPSGIHRGVIFEAIAGQTYHVAVDAEFERTGHYTFSWASRPPNDDFASPRILPGDAGTIVDANSKASRQDLAGEPDHEGIDGDASVWYAWTPSIGGPAVIDTLGTGSSGVSLAVYTGSTLTGLTPAAATEFMGDWRRVQFTASAGTTYRIAVDSPLFGVGFHLSWRAGAAESIAPTVNLTSPADGSRHGGLIPLAATATDASGIAWVDFLVDGMTICRDDTAPYACSWSPNFSGADRRSAFSAKAVDRHRNEATTPSVTSLGDSGPPEMTWAGHTTDPSFSTTASFDLTHDEDPPLGFECSFEDGPFEPCDLPAVHSGLSAGGHWWRGRTTDVFGNTSSAPATVLWEVIGPDTAKPNGNVAINAGSPATNKVTAALRLHAWDADSSITHVRVSNVPTTSGGLLARALVRGYASPLAWDLTATAYGGTAGDGIKAVYVQYRDEAGNWSPVFSDTIRLDRVRPTATGPVVAILAARQLGTSSFWARVRWTGADDASGVARYEVQRSHDGGAWAPTTLSNVTAGQVDVTLGYGPRYQFRVRAIDRAGNAGAWVTGPPVTPALAQETSTAIAWSTGWTPTALSGASGGSVRASSVAGARATVSFTGRGVAWVAATAPGRGTARVYSGTTLVATIDLDRPSQVRAVVFAWTWSSVAPRTIRVVVVGDGRIDIDAFVILR